ncbi:hypothetical protein b3_0088 [Synechococcus phage B3]|nr:hypothetical protein b3_0088 [Synechococcus phage B3]QGT54702.1 hypothetical protein b23_0087 [Synechococcus phage B23]
MNMYDPIEEGYTYIKYNDSGPISPPETGYPCWLLCYDGFGDRYSVVIGVWSESVEIPGGQFAPGFIEINLETILYSTNTNTYLWEYTHYDEGGIPSYDYRIRPDAYKLIEGPFKKMRPGE